MSVATFTKSGNKATTPAKLDKTIFGETIRSHELLKQAYLTYLANGRLNLAVTKERGEVRGGGRKPWRQKGTGRARFGSTRNPIWRGGGITFGPTGEENYKHKLDTQAKRKAIRQALSLATESNKVMVIESFIAMDKKTKDMAVLLSKVGAKGRILCVVAKKEADQERATRNIQNLSVVSATYLNVFDVMNADTIIISSDCLAVIKDWLTPKPKAALVGAKDE